MVLGKKYSDFKFLPKIEIKRLDKTKTVDNPIKINFNFIF